MKRKQNKTKEETTKKRDDRCSSDIQKKNKIRIKGDEKKGLSAFTALL